MKFLADENVSAYLVKHIAGFGYDIKYTQKGLKNSKLLKIAIEQERILITHDNDFANPSLYRPEDYQGIIVLRIHPPVIDKLKQALTDFLDKYKDKIIKGKIIIVEENGIRSI